MVREVMANTLSSRGLKEIGKGNLFTEAATKWSRNPFHKTNNKKGIVNLSLSENKLVFDLLSEKFRENKSQEILEEYTHYGPSTIPCLKEALVKFLDHFMKPVEPIDASNLLNMSGCTSVVHCLGYTLCNPGEAFLTPTPVYTGFYKDLGAEGIDVILYPIKLSKQPHPEESRPFELSVRRLEEAMENAKKENVRIKGLLLCNPNNPIGNIYSEELLLACLEFAHRHSLHVIVDEIYMLSIFKQGYSMKSILSLSNIPDKQRLHVVWGVSKDFGIAGFSCGFLHTWNKDLYAAMKKLRRFHTVPAIIQHKVAHLLSDLDWLDNKFVPANHYRLRECHAIICKALQETDIPFLDREAGLYVWADFSQIIPTLSIEGEVKLFQQFMNGGVSIIPGGEFSSPELGWFRIVFSVDPDTLRIAMERMSQVVNDVRRKRRETIDN